MSKFIEKIKCSIMSISFQERRKKELTNYKQKISYLKNMDIDELDLEYINKKSEYEHKKNILSIFMLSIMLSVWMDIWKYFFTFIEKIVQFAVSSQNREMAQMVFIISTIVIIFVTIIIFMILFAHMKRMHQLHKDLMIIEEIRKQYKK
jgi:hypothetical protein